jgi:hypothetical protein
MSEVERNAASTVSAGSEAASARRPVAEHEYV